MVDRDEVDDATVVERLSLFGAEYVPVSSLTPDELASLPSIWVDAASAPGGDAASLLAQAWRELTPELPRIAELVEKATCRVVVARMNRRMHWAKDVAGTEAPWSELGIVYWLRSAFDADDVQPWFGWRPGAFISWPTGSDAIHAVTGRLFGELQDGFVTQFDSGILPVQDWHSMTDLIADTWAFADRDGDELPETHRPDMNTTIIPAEDPTSWSHVVVAPGSATPLWAGFNDNLQARENLADEIESLVGRAWGGLEWYENL